VADGMKAAGIIRESAGAHWEKRGNALWVCCPSCDTWFPASPAMLAATAPPSCCPACHHEFNLTAIEPKTTTRSK
jgi:uncharacterized protein YbaR (Trm112 family)